MSDQFSLFEGESLKKEGMELGALNKQEILFHARFIAKKIACAREDKCCWIDLVQKVLLKDGIKLGMAAGSVFNDGCWSFTGKYTKSIRKTNHARPIKVWTLL